MNKVTVKTTVMSFGPTNACGYVCRCVDRKGSAVMLTAKRLTGLTREMNLKNRGSCKPQLFQFQIETSVSVSEHSVVVNPLCTRFCTPQ